MLKGLSFVFALILVVPGCDLLEELGGRGHGERGPRGPGGKGCNKTFDQDLLDNAEIEPVIEEALVCCLVEDGTATLSLEVLTESSCAADGTEMGFPEACGAAASEAAEEATTEAIPLDRTSGAITPDESETDATPDEAAADDDSEPTPCETGHTDDEDTPEPE